MNRSEKVITLLQGIGYKVDRNYTTRINGNRCIKVSAPNGGAPIYVNFFLMHYYCSDFPEQTEHSTLMRSAKNAIWYFKHPNESPREWDKLMSKALERAFTEWVASKVIEAFFKATTK